MVERLSEAHRVTGSIPVLGTNIFIKVIMQYIHSGGIFVRKGLALGVSIHNKTPFIFKLTRDGTVTYLAELHAIVDTIKQLLNSEKLHTQPPFMVYTSSPVLCQHLTGVSVPRKPEAIRLHNELAILMDKYDFLVEGVWVRSRKNPAQLVARDEKAKLLANEHD